MHYPPLCVTVAITGASGAIYGLNLLHQLDKTKSIIRIHLCVSQTGAQILREETGQNLNGQESLKIAGFTKVNWLDESNLGAPIASGSHPVDAMVVVPCSMASLGSIANGSGRNLIHRAAEVMLKEQRKLILVPREMPLSSIQIENMLKLSRAGAIIAPAMPPYYHHPQTITDLVEAVSFRIMNLLGFTIPPAFQWQDNR